jgi:hypothetical protein
VTPAGVASTSLRGDVTVPHVVRSGWVGALGLVVGSVAAAAAPSGAGAAPARPPAQTITFDVEGVHAWTVPPGVTYATIDAYGASGGGNDPGLGARVRATIAVSNGQTFTVVVAGEGGDPAGQTRGEGGFGGGGAGGAGGSGFEPFLPAGPAAGGGGGASDVRTGPADHSGLASRLLVAAGGGGGGLVGGGGGSAAASGQAGIIRWTGRSSGGGGGSSLVPATTDCPTIVEDGVRAGDGLVVIAFHKGNAALFACD